MFKFAERERERAVDGPPLYLCNARQPRRDILLKQLRLPFASSAKAAQDKIYKTVAVSFTLLYAKTAMHS